MEVLQIAIFAVLSLIVIGAGLAVVLFNRVTGSALSMALSFLAMAGMFVLLGAETIAAFQVLIYVGAITVLILYGVMLTRTPRRGASYALFFQKQAGWAVIPLAIIAAVTIALAFTFSSNVAQPSGGDIVTLGNALFREYAFPFEIASVLLLAAMVGAIALVKRGDD